MPKFFIVTTYNKAGEIPHYNIAEIDGKATGLNEITPRLANGVRQYFLCGNDDFAVVMRRDIRPEIYSDRFGREFVKAPVLCYIFKRDVFNNQHFYEQNDKYLESSVWKTSCIFQYPDSAGWVHQSFVECCEFYDTEGYKLLEKWENDKNSASN